MARLYATSGDGLARLDESGGEWTIELFLEGTRAQCLALIRPIATPSTPACGKRECDGRATPDGGGTTARRRIPASSPWPSVRPTARCTRGPSRAGSSAATTAARAGTLSTRSSSFRRGRRGASRPGPGRRTSAGSRRVRTTRSCSSSASSSAGSCAHRPRCQLAGPPARRAAGRSLACLAPARGRPRVRGGRRRFRVQHRRGGDVATRRRRPRPPLHVVGRSRPPRCRVLVRLREHRPLRRARRPRTAGAHLPAPRWRAMASARRRVARAAARDAVRAHRRRRPAVRRTGRRAALGERRPRRHLARVRASGRQAPGDQRARVRARRRPRRGPSRRHDRRAAAARRPGPPRRATTRTGRSSSGARPTGSAARSAPRALQVEHVGSTSVPGLAAKPIIDILLVVADSADEPALRPGTRSGRLRAADPRARLVSSTACSEAQTRASTCTSSPSAATEIERMLRFRDRLRANAADRALYEQTKRELAATAVEIRPELCRRQDGRRRGDPGAHRRRCIHRLFLSGSHRFHRRPRDSGAASAWARPRKKGVKRWTRSDWQPQRRSSSESPPGATASPARRADRSPRRRPRRRRPRPRRAPPLRAPHSRGVVSGATRRS